MVMTYRMKDSIAMLIKLDDDITRAAEGLTFDPTPDLLTHHMDFRKRNSGRLVSKFLKSFMQKT
jgi:hypothetical protein